MNQYVLVLEVKFHKRKFSLFSRLHLLASFSLTMFMGPAILSYLKKLKLPLFYFFLEFIKILISDLYSSRLQ